MADYKRVCELMGESLEACEASNFDLAITKAVSALGAYSSLPKKVKKDGFAGGEVEYDYNGINQYITTLKQCKRDMASKNNCDSSPAGIGVASYSFKSNGACCG